MKHMRSFSQGSTRNKKYVAADDMITAAKSLERLRDTWMYHAVSCF